jgi:DNA-binding NarL/FixJ family response regulator
MIRVLVADDEPLIRAGIRTVLESAADIEVVAQAEDGRAAIANAIRHRADVALIDIKMPVLDGLSAVKELRRQVPALPIVVLTAFNMEPNALRALQDGAAGFVLKNCTPDELIRAVRAAHAETTIKTYMSRILAKTSCSNRVQAALLARDAGSRTID